MTSLPVDSVPRATYRLQLTKDFTFRHAAALAPYLQRLGISHVYLSPILTARKGSTHGYDTVDHSEVNPELGTRAEFETMAGEFRERGIGIILDIVPNHMGIGGDENPYWLDVLKYGRASRYADWFDINWKPIEPALENKVLVPFLGTSFAEAFEGGKIELRGDDDGLAIWAEGSHKLPLDPETYQIDTTSDLATAIQRLNSPAGRSELLALIDAQHWKLARFSAAADDINYRRFFIVSDLAAIRIERDEVFDHVHKLVFDFVERGLVQGLRVDHIDGLYDPKAYCLKLREKCPRPIYLVVEKILAPGEALRADWLVDGTTGYEFAGAVTRLLVDPAADEKLTSTYESFTGKTGNLANVERDAKRAIIDFEMSAELDGLVARLRAIAVRERTSAGLTRNTLRNVLRETIASLPVYRTYVDASPRNEFDRRYVGLAVGKARQSLLSLDPAAFDFVQDILLADRASTAGGSLWEDVLDLARRIQQYTGPVMAKGLEDTALYRHNRLIALSDVGERPDRLSSSVEAFHDFNLARREATPAGMLTTSSHDSKRGEDARARIAALSGYADEWAAAVSMWDKQLADAGAPMLEANDRYYFFQLLLGSWPLDFPETGAIPAEGLSDFHTRLDAAMLKSVREARVRTNWTVPNSDYEADVARYVATALLPDGDFLEAFRAFDRLIGPAGAQNGIIEAVLKLTVPGVPDIYRGAELWEQSMVDPDNRRPVDFERRVAGLERADTYASLIANWRDGRLKQRIIADLFACRARVPEAFARGTYQPVRVASDNVLCFIRQTQEMALVVAVQLRPWRNRAWGLGPLSLPGLADSTWVSILNDDKQPMPNLSPGKLFGDLPVAVLCTAD